MSPGEDEGPWDQGTDLAGEVPSASAHEEVQCWVLTDEWTWLQAAVNGQTATLTAGNRVQ